MKALLIGLGLQGKAVLHDLERSDGVSEIVAADADPAAAKGWAAEQGLRKARYVSLDARDEAAALSLMRESSCDVVVCMLPAAFNPVIAALAIKAGRPFVCSSYAANLTALDAPARAAGVTLLPEMGFDPGIDLILAKEAIEALDVVEGLSSYGAGVPEPAASHNPLRYKITWTMDGVLRAYRRDAHLIEKGREVHVPGLEIFREANTHTIDVPGIGALEAYPNGDALHFIEAFGLDRSRLRAMGRYAARFPGHCAFWSKLADLGLLDEAPIEVGGGAVSPHELLVRHLTPRLQFGAGERDVAILRVEAFGIKAGEPLTITYDLVDYRDLKTGLFAMNRTVGYTTSIGAQLVGSGTVSKPGLLSPIHDVPRRTVLDALARRDVRIERKITAGHPLRYEERSGGVPLPA